MMDDRDINREIERVIVGLIGFAMLLLVCKRLWDWFSGCYCCETVWGAIAEPPLISGQDRWDYGYWVICPDGRLAACATLTILATTLLRAIFD